MKIKRRLSVVVIFLFFSAIILSESSPFVSAQGGDDVIAATQVFQGLDLVFLIDQSGSMDGNKGIGPNDPFRQRLYAVHYVIDYLGIDNLHYLSHSTHRIGVVSFGSEAQIDLPLTPFKTLSEEELTPEVMERRAADMQDKVRPDMMYDTHFIAAFELARKVFDDAEDLPGPRARAIIVLTDGQPAMELEDFERLYGYPIYENYFAALKEYVRENFPLAPEPRSTKDGHYHIWVVAMNNWDEAYWLDNEKYWLDIVGVDNAEKLSQNREDVPETFRRILTQIFDSCPLKSADPENADEKSPCFLEEGPFPMPPYLKGVVFYVFKSRPEGIVTFSRVGGQVLDCDDVDVHCKSIGPLNEEIFVERPEPGMWEWKKDPESRANVHYQPLFGEMEITPPQPHVLQQIGIVYTIIDDEGDIIEVNPKYPPRLNVTLTRPDGVTSTVPMKPDAGKAVSLDSQLLVKSGQHRLDLVGTAPDDWGREFQIFSDIEIFQVTDIHPRRARPGEDHVYVPFGEIEIAFELVNVEGSPIAVSPSLPFYMQLTLVSEAGDSTEHAMVLKGQSEYVAPVYLGKPGRYAIRLGGAFKQPPEEDIPFFEGWERYIVVDCLRAKQDGTIDEVPQNVPLSIDYKVNLCNGQAYVPDPQHPLTVEGEVRKPDGTTADIAITWDDLEQAYVAQITASDVDQVGDHRVAVTARGRDIDGSMVDVFQLSSGFTTYGTTPIKPAIVQPEDNERLAIRTSPRIPLVPSTGKPVAIPFAVELQNAQDSSVKYALVTDSPVEQLLSAEILDATGNIVDEPALEKGPTEYRLSTTSNKLTEAGEYRIRVRLNDQALRREYVPLQGASEEVVAFTMHDPTAIVTRIIAGAEIAALLALLIAIGLATWNATNTVRGQLVFDVDGNPVPVSLGGKRRVVRIGQKDLEVQVFSGDPTRTEELGKLKIRRSPNAKQGEEEIYLWAWDGQGLPIATKERLLDGDRVPLVMGVQVTYRYQQTP